MNRLVTSGVLMTLVLTGCGDTAPQRSVPAACTTAIPNVLPERWPALADRAADTACPDDVRLRAIRAMALAGPQANLVIPALTSLAENGTPQAIADEARAVLRAMTARRPTPTRR